MSAWAARQGAEEHARRGGEKGNASTADLQVLLQQLFNALALGLALVLECLRAVGVLRVEKAQVVVLMLKLWGKKNGCEDGCETRQREIKQREIKQRGIKQREIRQRGAALSISGPHRAHVCLELFDLRVCDVFAADNLHLQLVDLLRAATAARPVSVGGVGSAGGQTAKQPPKRNPRGAGRGGRPSRTLTRRALSAL